jgi:hypothetical protein
MVRKKLKPGRSGDNTSLKEEARKLIVVNGFTQKDAAKKVGITEKRISVWARKYNWKREILQTRKLIAGHLISVKGYTQKQAAKEVGVSEKTMSNWSRAGKWNDKEYNPLEDSGKMIKNFLIHVFIKEPKIHGKVKSLWNEYVDSLTNEIG